MVSLLAKPEVNINRVGKDGRTALLAATQRGEIDIVRNTLCSGRGVDTQKRLEIGKTIWRKRANESAQIIETLIEAFETDPVLFRSEQPQFSFSIACFTGLLEEVKTRLADKGFDPDRPIFRNLTPLDLACERGHKEIVELLLSDPRVKILLGEPSKNPLHIACISGHKQLISLLLLCNKINVGSWGPSALRAACEVGHDEVVERLLADPRIDMFDQTSRFVASCAHGRANIVCLFFKQPRFHLRLPQLLKRGEADMLLVLIACGFATREKMLALEDSESREVQELVALCQKDWNNTVLKSREEINYTGEHAPPPSPSFSDQIQKSITLR